MGLEFLQEIKQQDIKKQEGTKTKRQMLKTVEASHKRKPISKWNGGDLVIFFRDLEEWKYCHKPPIREKNNSTKLNFVIGGKMIKEYGAGGAATLVLASFFLDEIGYQIPPNLVALWHKDYRAKVLEFSWALMDCAKANLPKISKVIMEESRKENAKRRNTNGEVP